MRWLLVVAAVIACGPGLRGTNEYRDPKISELADELAAASTKRDVTRVRAMLGDSVTLGGVWFPDTACMIRFSAPGDVRGAALDELARCLGLLDLKRSDRNDALPDVVVLTYGAGLELEARFGERSGRPSLAWIGYSARRDLVDALPTITGHTLETLRVEGDPRAPLAGPGTFEELTFMPHAYAWLKVCIDATGAVTGTHVREASSPRAARAFAAATQTWRFKPFMLGTQPAPACAMVRMTYPAGDTTPEVLPAPLPAEPVALLQVPPRALGKLVVGSMMLAPDGDDKLRIAKSGLTRILSAFHICIDETGRVSRVALLRSSGLPSYDSRILGTIRRWAYKPYLDEGRAIPVCATLAFIYSQR